MAPALVAVAGVGLLIYMAVSRDAVANLVNTAADTWQRAYWSKPIPPQGPAPEHYLAQARQIGPQDCGICHAQQFLDWSGSLHARAMGPGVAGQFPTMTAADNGSCMECHAPLSEQWEQLPGPAGTWTPNAAYLPALRDKGVTCAACHLRRHVRNGPPLRPERAAVSQAVHGEANRTSFFEASEFCKGCHQHAPDTMRPGGKLVENTYQEWLESPYAARGVTCQGCHMPDRRHRWRGIHDAETTRGGVTIDTRVTPESPRIGDRVRAELTLTNSGTGHAFPTYTTPAVFLRAAFLDASGQVLPGDYFAETLIQRRLDMTRSPWGEEFDTRVLPGKSAQVSFDRRAPPGAHTLYLWVWVEPDHFYTGFFEDSLRNGGDAPGSAQLRQAWEQSLRNRYLLFSRRIAVAAAP
ncbi:MAG: hypothetical protein HY342_13120 [Candidatus Lambdaproteobacteria bacterium]|nr:hypothetical protein [Candidatus Lambdaproteobacteria bacterium]